MAIQVTCPGCFARFSVSDRFAGREGPCPKCKAIIKIPDKNEEVVIHAPEDAGPKDKAGRPVLKPIKRKENELSAVQIAIIIAVILGTLAVAIAVRLAYKDQPHQTAWWLLALGAFAVAFPVIMSGYALVRDQEIEPFRGQEYLVRLGICAAVFAATWGAMPVAQYAFAGDYGLASWIAGMVAMAVIGSLGAMFCWELEAIPAMILYGFFLGSCLLLRWIVGVGILPGMVVEPDPRSAAMAVECWGHCLGPALAVSL